MPQQRNIMEARGADDAEPEAPFTELLAEELKLDPCQWRKRPSPEGKRGEFEGQHFEVDSLVSRK